jgi:hypothetical protein
VRVACRLLQEPKQGFLCDSGDQRVHHAGYEHDGYHQRDNGCAEQALEFEAGEQYLAAGKRMVAGSPPGRGQARAKLAAAICPNPCSHSRVRRYWVWDVTSWRNCVVMARLRNPECLPNLCWFRAACESCRRSDKSSRS